MTLHGGGHEATLDMLSASPRRSPGRERLIAERERACGASFPASVVAWFVLEGADELFHDNTNPDYLAPLEELGDPEETRHGYLRVALENQGVVAFYVRLDEGDDPPVYDNNDQFDEPLGQVKWNLLSETFTTFIYDMVSIGRLGAAAHDLWIEAEGRLPTDAPRGLRLGPETRTAQLEVRRFHGRHELVTVRWEPGAELAFWVVKADTLERLTEVTAELGLTVTRAPRRRPRQARRGLLARLARRR